MATPLLVVLVMVSLLTLSKLVVKVTTVGSTRLPYSSFTVAVSDDVSPTVGSVRSASRVTV